MATSQDAVRETVALIQTCEATSAAIMRDYTKAIVATKVATAATQETAAPAATGAAATQATAAPAAIVMRMKRMISVTEPTEAEAPQARLDARPDWMLVLDAQKAIAASASRRATPATAWPSVPAAAAIAASASTSATPATAATGATD